jgi:hypothetical protein
VYVEALISLLYNPQFLYAKHIRLYYVLSDKPVSVQIVVLIDNVVIIPPVSVLITKPSSSPELSVHVHFTVFVVTSIALRLVGAFGGAGNVIVDITES